jgi:hypothetical protein
MAGIVAATWEYGVPVVQASATANVTTAIEHRIEKRFM